MFKFWDIALKSLLHYGNIELQNIWKCSIFPKK
mgnify:CR=1 FL=1